MASGAMVAGRWPTKVRVQCRNEEPFEAVIRFQHIPQHGVSPIIGEWVSDRPLVILD